MSKLPVANEYLPANHQDVGNETEYTSLGEILKLSKKDIREIDGIIRRNKFQFKKKRKVVISNVG